ncbi:hypothetical protein brsh051_11250 [Brooklawnia propionicigenes]|uniref:DNA primase n=1 Tax=Brooklawnia propionicigenes TaxID=3041175 RepID=A0AAN0MG85_9ACTN|nr:bifunctional DNA primase/polymerase [Brooklawnia sp. SH051]BEH01844.1 hypothetical protein brsh051_11250 [Brooklawnia sp. SH051]
MDEVRDTRVARGSTPGRASAVAAVFEGLREAMPLPVAAWELARSGVPVFPCAPGGKRPIPRRGFHEATTDLRQVEAWWRQRPGANIAVPTGAVSGVVVVDVDVHGVNGYPAASRAARAGLIPEPMATVTTPTSGRHLYFAADPDREQRSWQVARAGVDFRGDGGYIIVPPSARMIDGERVPYRVESARASAVASLDAQRLRDFLDPRPAPRYTGPLILSSEADVSRLVYRVASLREGERNLGLFKAACRLAEHGVPSRDALDVLTTAASQAGLGGREIARTVGSAYRHVSIYGPRTRAPARSADAFTRSPLPASPPLSRGL